MKLNNFIDKTLKAAKQSAQQIYGDDFSKLKGIIPENDEEQERNFSDGQGSFADEDESNSQKELAENTSRKGVVFERSEPVQGQENDSEDLNDKLDSIRKYAAELNKENEGLNADHNDASDVKDKSKKADGKPEVKIPKPVSELYSRKDIRPQQSDPDKTKSKQKKQQKSEKAGEKDPTETKEADSEELYDQLVDDLPNGISRVSEESDQTKDEQSKGKQDHDLHKRLERLEALVEGNLTSAGDERSTNPIYHKLMQRGVPQKLISSWFDTIKQQDIDPNQQQDLFRSKLFHLISQKIQSSQAGPTAKMLVLTGRSGSGKSSLAIKLATTPHFLESDNIAVVSFVPDSEDPKQNFSIVKPFCRNNDVYFYEIEHAAEVSTYQTEWETYDHILFDTPSLDAGGQTLTSAVTDLANELQSQATVETQYLVNTSVQGTAFNDPLAKEIAADHVSLTHLDQSTKWGKALPLLLNTDYKLRYVGSGPSLSGDLLPFDAEKFTRKLLRA